MTRYTPGDESKELESDRIQRIRSEVETLVQQVLPEQVNHVDEMLRHFDGREEELVDTLQVMQERASNQRARADAMQSAKAKKAALAASLTGLEQKAKNNKKGRMTTYTIIWGVSAVFAVAAIIGAVVGVRNNKNKEVGGFPSQAPSSRKSPTVPKPSNPSAPTPSGPTAPVGGPPPTIAPTVKGGNDLCANSRGPLTLGTVVSGSTETATVDDVGACGDASAPDTPGVWFTVMGTGTVLKATTCTGTSLDNSFKTQMSVWSGSSCDALQCVGGNVDDLSDFCVFSPKSGFQWKSEANQLYYILVFGDRGQTGTFGIKVTEVTSTPAPTTSPQGEGNCFTSSSDLQNAVDGFLAGSTQVSTEYGPIGSWCVKDIADFSGLFSNARNIAASTFNADISKWNVSSAVSMRSMFSGALSFNQDLSGWDTSQVTDMGFMFYNAGSMNRPLGTWNVAKVQTAQFMFYQANSFNQNLSAWSLSNATNLQFMFFGAGNFKQDLCAWGSTLAGKSIRLGNIFQDTACTSNADPSLTATPPGPFCATC